MAGIRKQERGEYNSNDEVSEVFFWLVAIDTSVFISLLFFLFVSLSFPAVVY